MRSAFALVLVSGLAVCTGCITGGTPIETKPVAAIEPVTLAPPVTSEAVTEDNYRACAKRLWDELDREEERMQLNKSQDGSP